MDRSTFNEQFYYKIIDLYTFRQSDFLPDVFIIEHFILVVKYEALLSVKLVHVWDWS